MIQIVKASAGSGKTHKLTGEYIKLLFKQNDNYRHILAVTFTNKATEEMKRRIILELDRLANNEPSDYLPELMSEGKSEDQIRVQAKKILTSILHDYSAFSISTIDRFFQQAVRSFTREVGLQGGYGIELNAEEMTEQAIDRLMFDLEDEGNEELIDWLVRFAQAQIEEGKEWNIKRNISKLARELQKEKYKMHADELHKVLSDKKGLSSYLGRLIALRVRYDQQLKGLGEKGLSIMTRCGFMPEDSSSKRFQFFVKLANGDRPNLGVRIMESIDNVDAWTTKKALPEVKAAAATAYENGLNDCLKQAVALMEDDIDYNTAGVIIRQFYALGILVDIDAKLRSYADEKNIMLLSDTTELLNKIIDGSDAPFVYEKIGTRIHHYMIDEFQDTSSMQWKNFYPLLNDSLANDNRNLIVGDVKQSIYRWRGSDWSLLGDQMEKQFNPKQLQVNTLFTNWRSSRLIIEFNNVFFAAASRLLQNKYSEGEVDEVSSRITDAYFDVKQSLPENKTTDDGHLKITFLKGDKTQKWQDTALERMVDEIERLQDCGYSLSDIAILVRRKDDGNSVAQYLLRTKNERPDSRYNYSFVSDEALYIDNSSAVRLLIAVLEYYVRPNEKLLRLLAGDLMTEDRFAQIEEIGKLPLFELCEQLVALFGLNQQPSEGVFLQAFQDCVLEYLKSNASEVSSFVDWWKESGIKRSIAAPKGQNAISIITIHKSKGLEFNAVIIPMCDWSMDHEATHTNILWSTPTTSPFNELPLVPIAYGKGLLRTHFIKEYLDEQLQVYVDNLNLGYVAFTRACKELIVFTPEEGGTKFTFSKVLRQCLAEQYGFELTEDSENCLEIGSTTSQTPKQVDEKPTIGAYVAINPGNRLQLRLRSKGFFSEGDALKYGNQMHAILSRVETIHDLDKAVERSVYDGEITEIESVEITDHLRHLITQPAVTNWFDGSYRIMNEVEILHPTRRFLRPDRIMKSNDELVIVDYKFGQNETKRYNKQVSQYMRLASEMGYQSVKGYLWYVEKEKIEEVIVESL